MQRIVSRFSVLKGGGEASFLMVKAGWGGGGAETVKTKNRVEVREQQEHESTTVGIRCWTLTRFGVHLYLKDFQLFSAAL